MNNSKNTIYSSKDIPVNGTLISFEVLFPDRALAALLEEGLPDFDLTITLTDPNHENKLVLKVNHFINTKAEEINYKTFNRIYRMWHRKIIRNIAIFINSRLSKMPLHINDPYPYDEISQWRLMLPKVNKDPSKPPTATLFI
jgi:hypothetical protein